MPGCYIMKSEGSKRNLTYLPQSGTLKNGRNVILDYWCESDLEPLYEIYSAVLEEGLTYPYESMDLDEFKAYFCSNEAFVLRDAENNEVLGGFYVKPNFPGRCSHISNSGFMVSENTRGQGVASFMGSRSIQITKDLGYLAIMFNLVFVTNVVSIKIWDKLGFKRIGIIPKAGNLKGIGFVDAIQYYYDLTAQ